MIRLVDHKTDFVPIAAQRVTPVLPSMLFQDKKLSLRNLESKSASVLQKIDNKEHDSF